MGKRNIRDLSIDNITEAVSAMGEKRHKTTQIIKWLYQKGVNSFSDMTNLSLPLRKRLDEAFTITPLKVEKSVSSKRDKSQKYLFSTTDRSRIESVIMEARGHYTVCLSSQVGCPLACAFCNTGAGGFDRNLTSGEILAQVLFFKQNHIPPRTRYNLVFMGMGDPMLNLENVSRALEIMNSLDAFALGEKRITVSTAGFPDRIKAIAATPLKFGLAISLNATTEEVRRALMPAAGPLEETMAAGEAFATRRQTRTTLEYVLIAGVNDSRDDARRLSKMTSGKPFKINLIPFNEWPGCDLRRPSEERIEQFIRILMPKAPAVTVRRSQGSDISAACGQLRADRGRGRHSRHYRSGWTP
ncbi:MAG: 23S rRNA (adenine(2503)-C(2))-methyltransferase RlmN [Bacteroidales bacterium]|nr:23S rRNA (adenine(2503)-C(2))-methyltransferase RlmN [Candidatus Latescibacterota bacterium]